ncbi:MAG: EamA family transporter [Propionibacteriaceae bacterium]
MVTTHLSGNIHPAPLAALQMGFSALLCAMFLPTGALYFRCSWLVALAIGFLGILGTGIAQAIFLRVIEQDGAVIASTVTYLVPVVAISIGPLVLHEQLAWTTLAGMAVTLTGVWLARRR